MTSVYDFTTNLTFKSCVSQKQPYPPCIMGVTELGSKDGGPKSLVCHGRFIFVALSQRLIASAESSVTILSMLRMCLKELIVGPRRSANRS